jgi:hydrogenase-4 component B
MSPGPLLASAALAQLASLGCRRRAGLWLFCTAAGNLAAGAAAVLLLARGDTWESQTERTLAGAPLHFRCDALSAFFLVLTAVIGTAGAAFGHDYWSARAHPRTAASGRLWWSVLAASLWLVLIATNGLHFLLGWELFTLAAYFLVTLERQAPAVRAAGWLYLGASHASMVALFAFFAGLAAAHGGDWTLGPMRGEPALAPLFWLALFGFGLKAGAFPLHIWLPSAHANAPSHVSALLSGVTIKLGIYGLVRFSSWLPLPAGAGWMLVTLGAASAVLGVAFALGQHDLKRLLAYHSVENIGIILFGLGFAVVATQATTDNVAPLQAWGALALAGGLLHVWNHGLFKALLFLGAGSVLHATGTREMSRLGGLWRAMPWTTALFALGAVAISGLPPLNGFVSEWLIYLGLFEGAIGRHGLASWVAVPAAVFLGATGALALACFIKVCGVVFLGAPRSRAAQSARECSPAMRAPMLLLGGACVAIGLGPVFFWPALARALESWQPAWTGAPAPQALPTLGAANATLAIGATTAALWLGQRVARRGPRRMPTWDCGYAAPSARMQYTAGSFAGIVTEWFAWILRPVRHELAPDGALPRDAACEIRTPETVLERLIEPLGALTLRLAAATRRLQHGRLQAYLGYLLVGLAALAAAVLLGESQ